MTLFAIRMDEYYELLYYEMLSFLFYRCTFLKLRLRVIVVV